MQRQVVSRTVAFPDQRSGPWEVEVRFGAIAGRVECIGIDIHPLADPPTDPLTTAVVRQVNLSALIDRAREDADLDLQRLVLPRKGFGVRLDTLRDAGLGPLAIRRPRPGPKPKSREHYEEVARVYLSSPRTPTRAVKEHFTVSDSTAAKYVAGARQRGLIAPTTRGKRSGSPTNE